MCVRDDSAAVASIPDIFKGTHQRFYYLRRSGLRYGKLSCATRIDVGRRQMGFLHLDGGQLASVDLDVAYVGLHALRFERMGALSPSGTKPARGERFKTGHSEVWDSYHFWFFNQGIFAAS